MTDIKPFLQSLLSIPGLSGYEEPACKVIEQQWKPLVDELSVSRLGSLHGLRKAAGSEACPTLMIAAHMDAIGLMVKQIKNGYLHITQVGGVDPRVLPGQAVTVHGRKDIAGIIQMIPDRLLPASKAGKALEHARLFVDTGLDEKELAKQVRIGDLISFSQAPILFDDEYIAGHSLDNRASVAALTICLEELRNYNLKWNLWSVATVQEETTLYGASTSAFQLMPQLGIAVDVTFAKGPGSNDHQTFPLGKGPTLGIGPNIHPALHAHFIKLAQEMDMPYAIEPMPASSGTDAISMQISSSGVPTFVVSIPIRYMHTPVELASLTDIKRVGRLLARFVSQLDNDSFKDLLSGISS
ncbi:MAG TPA: hypothetical protein PK040_03420 [Anaerolineaceae bacterium]|nr:hypothetical protein [Anaerolineaceae bacterium]